MSPHRIGILLALAVVLPDDARSQQPKNNPTAVREPALAVIDAFATIAKRDLWPGFRPDTIPLALYDGTQTWLFRHPAPPEGFRPHAPGSNIWVMDGRQPEVTANSSATIGGRTVATLIPDLTTQNAARWASVAAHEAFHAHQRKRHPTWSANEAVLFTYPWENAEALAERRLEFEALRRALAAPNKRDAACWATATLKERDSRFSRLGTDAARYETSSELNEGTAQYVQNRAAGTKALTNMPAQEFVPSGIRDRVYATGGAMGQLLDRLRPRWREELDQADSNAALHDELRAAVRSRAVPATACVISPTERDQALANANRDIRAEQMQLAALGQEFARRQGWSIVVDASARTLQVAGFDPLNVSRLSATTVLHRRYLKLANDGGEFESIDQEALTESAGSHPLFSGVRRVSVNGLSQAPTIDETGGGVALQVGELHLKFKAATVERDGQRVTILLK